MRTRARIDGNHTEIAAALRKAGATVESLAPLGRGVPDLLVGHSGRNYLLEIKDGAKRPSRRRLTQDEREWHAGWRGMVQTVECIGDALRVIGLAAGPGQATKGKD